MLPQRSDAREERIKKREVTDLALDARAGRASSSRVGAREEEPIDLASLSDGSESDDIVVTGTSNGTLQSANQQAMPRERRQLAAGGTFDREMEREPDDQYYRVRTTG